MLKSLPVSICVFIVAAAAAATTIIPISDAEMHHRSDVIVYGTVMANETAADTFGRVETITTVSPIEVLKGILPGDLVLHQLGGELADGRFFKMYGRPEYSVGSQVVVFAISRPEGGYQTSEMILGKFEVLKDTAGQKFAVPDFERGVYEGVVIYRGTEDPSTKGSRDLGQFLSFLRGGATGVESPRVQPVGALSNAGGAAQPKWGFLNNTLYRWNNGATAAWTKDGAANMTGGATAQLTAALASWTNEPNSTINYTDGTGTSNLVHLNASSSPCGWTTCFPGSGVIGCGGPSGSGSHTFRGDTYATIVGGEVWMRCFSSPNQLPSPVVQAVLTHELGHTLGLGHSDQNSSIHDVCAGDTGGAIMFSSVSSQTALGTDDTDAIRWVYGDGLNSCTAVTPPTVGSISPTSGTSAGGVTITINGTNFVSGSTVTVGAGSATGTTLLSATQLRANTPGLSAGTLNNVTVSTPSSGSATLTNGFLSDFLDVPQAQPFHSFVEKIFRFGITGGCGGGNYCPSQVVTRDQMAIFLERGMRGGGYTPPPATGSLFVDVPVGAFASPFIEQLSRDGITGGCAPSLYCSLNPVLRSQMAIFLLRAKHGGAYTPPAATGTVFNDVAAGAFGAAWIEQLAAEGITTGCGGGNYCPNNATTRGEMSAFLSRTFALP